MPSMPRRCGCKQCVHQSCRSPLTRQRVTEDGRYSKTVAPRATVGRNGRRARCSTRTIQLLSLIPTVTPPGFPRDPGVSFAGPGGQIISYTVNAVTLRFLDNIGTFRRELTHWKSVVQRLEPLQGAHRLVSLDLMRHRSSAHATMRRICITVLRRPSPEAGASPCITCQDAWPGHPGQRHDYDPGRAERRGASGSAGVSERHRRPHG